jgi:predicted enzyme involved in methoxymalonyl-ACP biosynthesis
MTRWGDLELAAEARREFKRRVEVAHTTSMTAEQQLDWIEKMLKIAERLEQLAGNAAALILLDDAPMDAESRRLRTLKRELRAQKDGG